MMADRPISLLLADGTLDNRHRIRPGCRFYSFDDEEPIIADNYLTSFRTSKSIGEPAGTWTVGLATQPLVPGQAFELIRWHERVKPGDWVLLDASDGAAEWPIMLGVVDRVHRSRVGPTLRYTITGRDFGKCLTNHDIIVLPQYKSANALDLVNDLGPFYQTLDRITTRFGKDGVSPAELLPQLALFFLGSVTKGERGAAPVFHLPRSMHIETDQPVDLEAAGLPLELGLPLGELLRFAVDPDLTGRAVLREMFEGLPDGMKLWDYLASWANTELNEFYCDFLPRSMLDGGRPLADAYQWNRQGGHPFLPAIVLRERPFPTNAHVSARQLGFKTNIDLVSGYDRWVGLPWTEVDERQLVQDETGVSDAERANFFLAVPHASYTANPYTLALGASGRGKLPIITPDSAARYGWQRRQMSSPYLPTDPNAPTATYYEWSRQISDWYERNAEYLSGDLESARMLPGVHVGEKLIVHRDNRAVRETYYVEGVTHAWQKAGDAHETSSTAMVVTRGSTDDLGGFRL